MFYLPVSASFLFLFFSSDACDGIQSHANDRPLNNINSGKGLSDRKHYLSFYYDYK